MGRDGENNCPTCWHNAVNMKADNKSGSVNRSQRLILILIRLNSELQWLPSVEKWTTSIVFRLEQ